MVTTSLTHVPFIQQKADPRSTHFLQLVHGLRNPRESCPHCNISPRTATRSSLTAITTISQQLTSIPCHNGIRERIRRGDINLRSSSMIGTAKVSWLVCGTFKPYPVPVWLPLRPPGRPEEFVGYSCFHGARTIGNLIILISNSRKIPNSGKHQYFLDALGAQETPSKHAQSSNSQGLGRRWW